MLQILIHVVACSSIYFVISVTVVVLLRIFSKTLFGLCRRWTEIKQGVCYWD